MKSGLPIGIVGAGPAGSTLARLLAGEGVRAVLIDERRPHEKACGGGLTVRSYRSRPLIREALTGCVEVRDVVLESGGRQVTIRLPEPVRIYPRRELNQILFQAALDAGAHFLQDRARSFRATGSGYLIDLAGNPPLEVSFLVGADGATGICRGLLGGGRGRKRFALACGFRAEREPGEAIIRLWFPPDLEGYLWIFPRSDHFSIGICCRDSRTTPQVLGDLLRKSLDGTGRSWIPLPESEYSFPIPDFAAFDGPRGGPGWALIGDAGGFVDPITLEGIPYALRSAEILARTILESNPVKFEAAWRADFGRELRRAAGMVKGFYKTGFRESMVRLAPTHPRLYALLAKLLCGATSYRWVRLRVAGAFLADQFRF